MTWGRWWESLAPLVLPFSFHPISFMFWRNCTINCSILRKVDVLFNLIFVMSMETFSGLLQPIKMKTKTNIAQSCDYFGLSSCIINCYKLLQSSSWKQHAAFIILYTSLGQQFRNGLLGSFWLVISSEGAVNRRFDWSWRVQFPDSLHINFWRLNKD